MANKITNLNPNSVWKHFADISRIPRASKHEQQIADYLAQLFKAYKATSVYRDNSNNVVAHFAANHKAYANHKTITLHAHSDMVTAKGAGVKHNFLKDPITLKKNNEWVYANGTTLGADDGMGIAMILAIISDKNIKHGPLEVVITSDEEEGQSGINNLDKSKLHGKYLISLDGYNEREILVGSASVVSQFYEMPVTTSFSIIENTSKNNDLSKRNALLRLIKVGKKTINNVINIKNEIASSDSVAITLSVSDLIVGHVALNMNRPKHIQNAIKEIFYILHLLSENVQFNIVEIHGGQSNHSIPNSCKVTILVKPAFVKTVHNIFNKHAKFLSKLHSDEKYMKLTITNAKCDKPYISLADSMRIVNFVNSIYNGVTRYDSISNIYNGCSYIGAIQYLPGDKIVKFYGGNRSISAYEVEKESLRMASLCKLLNIKYSIFQLAVAWTPKIGKDRLSQQLLYEMNKLLPKTAPAKTAYTLGGCEAAKIISNEHTHFDSGVLWAPTIQNMHSPHERVNIKSVQRCFKALCEVLKKLN